jgi:hypothetical protein
VWFSKDGKWQRYAFATEGDENGIRVEV